MTSLYHREMTELEFNNYTDNVIPQKLYQLKKGRVYYEKTLVKILSETPELLNMKPLQWFIDYFLAVPENIEEEYVNGRKPKGKIKRFEDLMDVDSISVQDHK